MARCSTPTHSKWPFPVKLVRDGEASDAPLKPFRFYGPTCDSIDAHAGAVLAARGRATRATIIEIGMLGAYGVGHDHPLQRLRRRSTTVEVDDAPMASMLRPGPALDRHAPRRDGDTVVKLSRARGKKRRRR